LEYKAYGTQKTLLRHSYNIHTLKEFRKKRKKWHDCALQISVLICLSIQRDLAQL